MVLNNPGEINISNGGNIVINPNCVLNNSGTGIIDFQSAGSEITGSTLPTTLNNFGKWRGGVVGLGICRLEARYVRDNVRTLKESRVSITRLTTKRTYVH